MEKNLTKDEPHKSESVTLETRIQILLEEYRALYSLLTFRLTAMDRRLPAIGGTLAGILGSTTAMPNQARLSFLLGLPIALLWLFLSTVQHARSKEDHVRRIDEIERLVNALAGEELLVFQSRHPNKARHPGGRTGFSSMLAVLSLCLIMLGVCVYTLKLPKTLLPQHDYRGYVIYVAACAIAMLIGAIRLTRYRYRPTPPAEPPVFAARRA